MKLPQHVHDLARIGPVYLVGGSVRDYILNRPCSDHDFAVPENAKAFAEEVARRLHVRMIEIGKVDDKIYRIVTGNETLDFSTMASRTIEGDLKRRDFSINALAYDLRYDKLIDPFGGLSDMASRNIRLVSEDAVLADPLRMLRAFRFAVILNFTIAAHTLAIIQKHSPSIKKSAGERVRAEIFKMMEAERSFYYLKQMSQAGLLTEIFPELEPCRDCLQNDMHGFDVFEHSMGTYDQMEGILANRGALWPGFAQAIDTYLEKGDRKVLLKWAALLHDVGKPETRSVDEAGKVRFLGHDEAGARLVHDACTRLRLAAQDRSYVTFLVQEHLRPLLLFDAYQRQSLTSRGIVRFVKKFADDIIGLLIHSLADQRAKKRVPDESLHSLATFLEGILSTYSSDLKPKMATPRLLTGHDLIHHFGLKPSKQIGKLLERIEEARLNGEIKTKEEALELAGRWLEVEGDAGIEPATPSSGGLCSIR